MRSVINSKFSSAFNTFQIANKEMSYFVVITSKKKRLKKVERKFSALMKDNRKKKIFVDWTKLADS